MRPFNAIHQIDPPWMTEIRLIHKSNARSKIECSIIIILTFPESIGTTIMAKGDEWYVIFFHLNDGKTFKILKCKMKSLLKLNASNWINLVRPLEVSNQFKLLNMQIQYHQNRFWKVKWIVNVPEKVLVIYRQFDQNFHYNIFSIPYMNIFNLEQ